MNTPIAAWRMALHSAALAEELRSPAPSLLDRILAPLSATAVGNEGRPVLPWAVVVLTPDGRPIRTVLTGRRVMVTGFYSSRKAGRALPYEGMNELALLKWSEVDTHVVDYRSQPFRFEFAINGVKRIYIADCVRLLDDGSLEVVEVKGHLKQLQSPEYAEKIAAVREVCASLGWRFRILGGRQLLEPHAVFANVDLIQSRRMVKFDDVDAYKVVELIERLGGETTVGSIIETLGGEPRGLAVAQAMMVRRLLSIDLKSALTADTRVSAVRTSNALRRGDR